MWIRTLFFAHVVFLSFFPFSSFSQKSTISGFVKDAETNEALIDVKVYSPNLNQGAITNASGYFSLTLPNADYQLVIDAFGYERELVSISFRKDTVINFFLKVDKVLELDEINVVSKQDESFGITSIGLINVSVEQLKNIPNLAGEPDIVKAFQLMPGVQSGSEGTSGLYVRGGTPDQNLFLLDNTPLYYVSHIGGFVSTFDPNAINSIKLYKGGFPARYNGRLSSVIDIKMKDGNQKKRRGEIAVGLLTTKFQIDGPLSKDSSITYFFSARRFNLDLFTRLFARIDSKGESSAGYTFYDLNGKLVKRFNNNGKLTLTLYEGRDRIFVNASKKGETSSSISYKNKSNVRWGNFMGNLNYSQSFGKKLFGDISLASTNFKYTTDVNGRYSNPGQQELVHTSRIKFVSQVNDIILKAQLQYEVSPSYKLTGGATSTFHRFTPGRIQYVKQNASDTLIGDDRINAFENNLFIENQLKLGDKFDLNFGLNFTSFAMKDTVFNSLQPRLIASWEIYDNLVLQGGFSRMNQNMHYLTNSGTGLPSDLWIPVSKKMLPEVSNQYNIGFTYSLKNRKFPLNFILEGYYKDLSNLIDYREGSNLFQTTELEDKIVSNGTGKVFGIEFLIQKKIGRLTGWVGYTLSKNTRQFDEVNNGEPYPFIFDRTHDVSLTMSYKVNERVQITGTWVYATGSPVTLAKAQYDLVGLDYDYPNNSINDNFLYFNSAHVYDGKNNARLPDYHKLDVGIRLSKEKPRGIRTWYFGVYNAYNRQNPFFLFYKENSQGEVTLHQLTLFPIIPSFSYSFVF